MTEKTPGSNETILKTLSVPYSLAWLRTVLFLCAPLNAALQSEVCSLPHLFSLLNKLTNSLHSGLSQNSLLGCSEGPDFTQVEVTKVHGYSSCLQPCWAVDTGPSADSRPASSRSPLWYGMQVIGSSCPERSDYFRKFSRFTGRKNSALWLSGSLPLRCLIDWYPIDLSCSLAAVDHWSAFLPLAA